VEACMSCRAIANRYLLTSAQEDPIQGQTAGVRTIYALR